jgi:hypothetical protein
MSDPYARLQSRIQEIGNKMKTRKTPCQGHGKPAPSIVAMECPGCGEWNNVNGKWVRP